MTGRTCIEFKGVKKRFGRTEVLSGIDLQILEGEAMALLGRSGSGKSVMIKHIIGLIKPDAGRVIVDGEDITDLSEEELLPVRKKVSMLFQSAALFDSMTVLENVGFPLRQHTDMSVEEIEETARKKLEMVGLKDVDDLYPSELSGGMKKRVGFARALALDPDIILYDEPTTGLDPITRRRILELIRDIHEKLKTTSIVVTHDVDLAFTVADRVAFLHSGRICAVGTPADLADLSAPGCEPLRAFLHEENEKFFKG